MALKQPFRVGGLLLKNNTFLSPLEGVSCVGFRALCHQNGAALTFTEMIRAKGIIGNNQATLDLIDTFDDKTPTGIQLLAKSVDELQAALLRLSQLSQQPKWHHFKNICAVDINLGCPSPDIIREGAGPALLKRKRLLRDMFTALVQFKSKPENFGISAVGCKIRLGLNGAEESHKIYLQVAEAACDAGLDWITVHARNARMRSSHKPYWPAIGEVKNFISTRPQTIPPSFLEKLTVPKPIVIGNGNIACLKSRQELYDLTSCDGVMIARAAIQNPWIFCDMCEPSLPDPSGSVESGISFSHPSHSTYPTIEQVRYAKNMYLDTAKKHKTKPKFVSYHVQNFQRLLRAAETQDFSQRFQSPNTIHLAP